MARAGFLVPNNLFEGDLEEYSNEELGRIFRAMMMIANGEEVELSREEKRIIRDWQKLDDVASKRYKASVENGKKGGRPKTEDIPKEPDNTQENPEKPSNNLAKPPETNNKDKDKDNTKDNTKDNIPKGIPHVAFKKPTVEEIDKYCEERHNGIDPESFYDFYEARGWYLSNGKRMVDWKACVRTWEQRRKERQTQNIKQKTKLSDISERNNNWDEISKTIPDPLENMI